MAVLLDARGNEYLAAIDAITGQTVTDARASSASLAAVQAETATDLNGQAVWLVDARTGAASLTFVFEGTIDGTNYFTLNAYDTSAPSVVVASVVISTTLAKAYYVPVGGYRRVRVRVSAYTSGNVTVATRASMAGFTDVLAGTVAIGPTIVPGTAATNLGKQRTAVIGATDTGVELLARAVTTATAVTNTQLDVPQLEAATGALFVNSPVNVASGITKQRTAAPGATDAAPAILVRSVTSPTATTNGQYDLVQQESATGAVFVNSPTAATAILKARAAAPGAADAGVEMLAEALTANTAVTTAQYHRPQLEANSGALFTRDTPSTANGLSISHLVVAATTNGTSVKGSAGNVYGWSISNKSAAVQFFKLFNKATAPTTGTDTPVITVAVPALSTVSYMDTKGLSFALGIGFAYTNLIADLDNTVVVAADAVINLFYK